MDHQTFIKQMTLKEKADATVMEGGRCFVTERLENTGFNVKDNPRGNEDYQVEAPEDRKAGDYYPVAWPQAAAAAAAWDENVSYEIGKAMGRECKIRHIHVLLRPGVNIKRSPLCGRNFEYYSEDPVLAGRLGGAFIRGAQSEGTAACVKHYTVNSQEFERMTTNAVVSERALRELYLKSFEIAIKSGDPWTLMTSYNKVNGQWVPANEALMKILREDFGFKGVVLSDAMAVQTEKVLSHKCGLDFELGSRGLHSRELQSAIEEGLLDEKVLDKSIDKMLTLQDQIGCAYGQEGAMTDTEEAFSARAMADHVRARELAAQTLVLLKNNGVLPLKRGKKVAVIGKLAKYPNYMGCGSGHMNGWKIDSTWEELSKLLGDDTELIYEDGYEIRDRVWKELSPDEARIKAAVDAAQKADIVLFFSGLPVGYESEGYDRETLALPKDMQAAMEAVLDIGKPTVIVNVSGSPVDLAVCKEKAEAILHGYMAGESLGGAIADVLTGAAEPGGRLPETFPLRLEDTPSFMSFPSYPTVMPDVLYGEDIFVGYRWYEKRRIPTLYPFGHGLSYTTFSYSQAELDREKVQADDTVTVRLKVKNTGKRKGSQVFQLYVSKPDSSFIRPEKELKAFARAELEPGEEKTVELSFACEDLGVYDETHKRWVRESGRWEIIVGTSSAHVIKTLSFEMENGEDARIYHRLLALEWFNKHPEINEILKNRSQAAKKFLGTQNDMMGDLICALPVYRVTEDSLWGSAAMDPNELAQILDELNKRR